MRPIGIALFLPLAVLLLSSQDSTTTCTQLNNTLTCKSNTEETVCTTINDETTCKTKDLVAQKKADQEAADAIVGKPIMAWRVSRGIKKYCKDHPGEPYHWTMPDGKVVRRGVCPAKH